MNWDVIGSNFDIDVVKRSDSEYYVEMSRFTLSDWVIRTRSAFVINDETTSLPLGVSLPRATGMFITYGGRER